MGAYATVIDGGSVLVVRSSDSRVVARCDSQTFANQVVAGLDGLAAKAVPAKPRRS